MNSSRHKKQPEELRKITHGRRKEGQSECCPLCKKVLPNEDALIDHFGQSLCPKVQHTGTNPGASKALVDHANFVSNILYNDGGPALSSVGTSVICSGPALDNTDLEARSDGPLAISTRKKTTRFKFKFNKFSHRKEADMGNVNWASSKKQVGGEQRIK